MPTVEQAVSSDAGLEESYKQWLERGKDELAAGRFEEAAACLQEALRRLRGLDVGSVAESEVRLLLAEALEKAKKLAEAAQQLELVAGLDGADSKREELVSRAGELKKEAVDLSLTTRGEDVFRALEPGEARVVPLYCSACRRLLAEAEVFGFRRGAEPNIRCLCGMEAAPLAKLDAKHARALREAASVQGRKAQLIEAGSRDYPGGKNRYIAAALAVLLGNFGIHRVYLGEGSACVVYILFCWTFLPWVAALFEAVGYMSMSNVTFNLSYNIDRVLAALPAETTAGEDHSELFSMEVTEDPEDFVDEFTAGTGSGAESRE
jgi:TM2 domain-containing membrane protein YozV